MRRFLWPTLTIALFTAACSIPTTGVIALDDQAAVDSGGRVTIPVLLNDRPPPGETLLILAVDSGAGAVDVVDDRTLVYTAAEGFSGIDHFSYLVGSETSQPAVASVTVSVATPTEVRPGKVVVDPRLLVFGGVEVGGEARDVVRFTNPGPGAIPVGDPFIEPDGAFSVVGSDCGPDLEDGASCDVEVAFHPGSEGPHAAALALGDSARAELHGTGTDGNPGPGPSPLVLVFGGVEVGGEARDGVRFTNPGPGAIPVGDPFMEPDGAFSVVGSDCGPDLEDGASCDVEVAFHPGSEGPHAAALALGDSARAELHGIGIMTRFEGCARFEDLTVGTIYGVGDVFVTSDIVVEVAEFTYGGGATTSGGFTMVEAGDAAGGSGQDLQVNNVLLRFGFDSPIEGLSLDFGAYGGNLNLEINGEFVNFGSMDDINGIGIGGTEVFTTAGGGRGSLIVFGFIESFAIGGQELWIDDVCTPPEPVAVISQPTSSSDFVYQLDGSFDVFLDGTQSFDPFGGSLRYEWTVKRDFDDEALVIGSAASGMANFPLRAKCNATITFHFELLVTNDSGRSNRASVNIPYNLVC